jgi:RimJ/RimL family protein N-acetyltransferase
MNKQITILETEQLLLRRLQPSDVSALIDLWCDPDATRYMGGPRDRENLQTVFEEDAKDPFAEEFDLWPVVEKQTQEVVGHCGLLDKEVGGVEEIEVNYIFKPSAWGKGYATEIGSALIGYAFEELKLKRLIALIEPDNAPSERVAVKIGMRFEKEVIRPGGKKRKVYVIEAKSQIE